MIKKGNKSEVPSPSIYQDIGKDLSRNVHCHYVTLAYFEKQVHWHILRNKHIGKQKT